jgi:FO synthase subunit 2
MNISAILAKVSRGGELTSCELLLLMKDRGHEDEIITAADAINQTVNHDVVTFVHNRNINYTNICRNRCLFCAFRRESGDFDSYSLSVEDVVERISKAPEITEVCIQGGIRPGMRFSYILQMLQAIKGCYPTIHIHAFSPMEIKYFSEVSGKGLDSVLDELIECGLDSVPGTAAEILDVGIRRIICPQKISGEEWEEIITMIHERGLRSTATILIGHIESAESIVHHMEHIRNIQRRTRGFTEFIPLIFVPFFTVLGKKYGIDKVLPLRYLLKFYALSRLYFNGYIKNIQVSWPKLGFENALSCLFAGANDLGGTLYEENITRSAGGRFGQMMRLGDFNAGISRIGKIPKLRDTLYRFTEEDGEKIRPQTCMTTVD